MPYLVPSGVSLDAVAWGDVFYVPTWLMRVQSTTLAVESRGVQFGLGKWRGWYASPYLIGSFLNIIYLFACFFCSISIPKWSFIWNCPTSKLLMPFRKYLKNSGWFLEWIVDQIMCIEDELGPFLFVSYVFMWGMPQLLPSNASLLSTGF